MSEKCCSACVIWTLVFGCAFVLVGDMYNDITILLTGYCLIGVCILLMTFIITALLGAFAYKFIKSNTSRPHIDATEP